MSNENSVDQTKMVRDRKLVPRDDLGYSIRDINKNKASTTKSAVNKKCEKGLNIIKKNPLSEQFYHSISADVPSLSAIEKKIRNNKYESFDDFSNDLRKLWSYYFSNYSTNPDIYQKTLSVSNFTEGIINDLQSNSKLETNDIKEITKKINTLQKDLKDIKGNQIPNQERKYVNTANIGEIPMTQAEKTQLSINIKKLPTEQLMGIIQIMKDTINLNDNKSHMEFDINSLPTRKLRELEKYVNTCMKNSNKNENYQKLKTDLTQKGGAMPSQAQSQGLSQGNNIKQLTGNSQTMQSNTIQKTGNTTMSNNNNQGEKKGTMIDQAIPKKQSNTDKGILSESDSSSSSDSNSDLSSFN